MFCPILLSIHIHIHIHICIYVWRYLHKTRRILLLFAIFANKGLCDVELCCDSCYGGYPPWAVRCPPKTRVNFSKLIDFAIFFCCWAWFGLGRRGRGRCNGEGMYGNLPLQRNHPSLFKNKYNFLFSAVDCCQPTAFLRLNRRLKLTP